MPKTLAVVIDNYRSVNDGEGLNVSTHSPVFGTFVLRLRHNFDKILQDSAHSRSTGNIRTVLSALSQSSGSVFFADNNSNNTSSGGGSKTVEFPGDAPPPPPSAAAMGPGAGLGMVTPPRSKHSGGNHRHSTGATDPGRRSNLTSLLGVAGESNNHNYNRTHNKNNNTSIEDSNHATATTVPRSLKYSLLPPGVYRIRISNIKLIWGMNEEAPASVSLLFPSPYEVKMIYS